VNITIKGAFELRLANRIFVGLLLGIVFGLALYSVRETTWVTNLMTYLVSPLGDAFIRAIRMIVVPLVLASIVVGTAASVTSRGWAELAAKLLAFT